VLRVLKAKHHISDDSRGFWGYALLLNILSFPKKFFFFDFNGLSNAPVLTSTCTFFKKSLF
jgi:type VI protein secretion system component VasA